MFSSGAAAAATPAAVLQAALEQRLLRCSSVLDKANVLDC
jgi:hypothetical protein